MTQTRILLLDDQNLFARLIATILEGAGYQVAITGNGMAALHAERRFRPHLAILDIDMPGISGLEVLLQLRERRSSASLPVVMSTARTEATYIEQAKKAGANAYLTKPYSAKQILDRVQQLLRATQASQAPSYVV